MPGYVSCSKSRCQNGGIVGLARKGYFACSSCRTVTCLQCQTRHHPGISHEQNLGNQPRSAAERRQEEAASRRVVAEISKTCPNGDCGAQIQKTAGCDQIKCRACGHDFCWICRADYRLINLHGLHQHKETCAHYVGPLSARDLDVLW